ncbi:MAG: CDP-glycerol glycerophosphotransferase family protein [Bacillales bacterium]|nr:CDP-glycerol glycerophosphotransferase family protein [Bacillales bacterium]
MYYKNTNLHILIHFTKPKSINTEELSLLFVERYKTKKIEFHVSVTEKNIVAACLSEIDLQQLTFEGKDWDIYIKFGNGTTDRTRIRSNFMDLELLFFNMGDQMLVPFTTRKGNISFKSRPVSFITKVDHFKFIDKKDIVIRGYLVNPQWTEQPINFRRKLILYANDEAVFQVPVKTLYRKDLSNSREGYDLTSIGFEGIIPINILLSSTNQMASLKARIQTSYRDGRAEVTDVTLPLNIKSPKFPEQSLIIKVKGIKKRISLNRTLKGKHINIKITDYNFKNDIELKVKETLVSIKRHYLVKKLYKNIFYCIGILPNKNDIVVFESFLGKQYSDNPRAIYEYLKDSNYPYKLYWSVDRKFLHNFQDKNLICIRRFSIKWLLILPRARFWVTNSRMPLWIPKPKNTVYLQTWHGTPLKRLAADMDEVYLPGTTAESYKKNFITEAKNWDYLISPNAYSTEIFRRAFQFEKEVLETGYPRNDFICNNNDKENIEILKKKHGIPMNKKIILYAPTWRDNQFYAKGKYRFDINMDLNLMRERLGENYVVLFRLHYLISENLDLSLYEGFAFDFSNYEDIRELYLVSDILITDYSSVFFDYANLKRPMIFYVYDIEQYRDNLRGFYFDFEEEAPGPLVKTTEEVVEEIHLPTEFDRFYQKFCYLECGDSTRKVVERIFRS